MEIVVYSDISVRKDYLRATVVILNDKNKAIESQQIQVEPMDQ